MAVLEGEERLIKTQMDSVKSRSNGEINHMSRNLQSKLCNRHEI